MLDKLPLGQRRLERERSVKENELGRKFDWHEFSGFAESLRDGGLDTGESVLRMVVYDNPYARIALRRDVFTGPFDERFGPEGDHMARLFAGSQLQKLEAEERSAESAEEI